MTGKVSSMTAFARATVAGPWGQAIWEMRSVNHRYREMTFRLPDVYREFETAFRHCVEAHVARGKLDITLTQQSAATMTQLQLHRPLATQVCALYAEVAALSESAVAPLSPIEVMRWPGVVSSAAEDCTSIAPMLMTGLEEAVRALCAARESEGARLEALLVGRLQQVRAIVAQLQQDTPTAIETQRERLRAQLADLSIAWDEQRYAQEVVQLAQRADVTEELERLLSHVQEVEQSLRGGGCIGRRLDFFMQELHREANTLSSKSSVAAITQAAVELKVVIEQLREQIQNLE